VEFLKKTFWICFGQLDSTYCAIMMVAIKFIIFFALMKDNLIFLNIIIEVVVLLPSDNRLVFFWLQV
jgi:hypothetical protein